MKKLIEKKLNSKIVFNGNFLKIWRDQIELHSKLRSEREYIKHPGAACIVPILPNGNLIMIKQFRYATNQIFLEFPAGKIDKGENSKQTAFRELEEETGYKTKKIKLLTRIHPAIGYSNEFIDIYVASELIKTKQKTDPDEVLQVVEMNPEKVEKLLLKGKLTDVKTQIAFQWFKMNMDR